MNYPKIFYLQRWTNYCILQTVTAFAFDKDYVDKMERREHSHGMEDLSVVNEFLEVRIS